MWSKQETLKEKGMLQMPEGTRALTSLRSQQD